MVSLSIFPRPLHPHQMLAVERWRQECQRQANKFEISRLEIEGGIKNKQQKAVS